jgi:hypothetical protein
MELVPQYTCSGGSWARRLVLIDQVSATVSTDDAGGRCLTQATLCTYSILYVRSSEHTRTGARCTAHAAPLRASMQSFVRPGPFLGRSIKFATCGRLLSILHHDLE